MSDFTIWNHIRKRLEERGFVIVQGCYIDGLNESLDVLDKNLLQQVKAGVLSTEDIFLRILENGSTYGGESQRLSALLSDDEINVDEASTFRDSVRSFVKVCFPQHQVSDDDFSLVIDNITSDENLVNQEKHADQTFPEESYVGFVSSRSYHIFIGAESHLAVDSYLARRDDGEDDLLATLLEPSTELLHKKIEGRSLLFMKGRCIHAGSPFGKQIGPISPSDYKIHFYIRNQPLEEKHQGTFVTSRFYSADEASPYFEQLFTYPLI